MESAPSLAFNPCENVQGNYIILDVHDSNLPDLVVDAEEGGIALPKRSGFAEKLLCVRNSQCDSALARSQRQLKSDQFKRLRKYQENSSKIKYEYKVMLVDKKKNELEVLHRTDPQAEISYEDQIVLNSTKYLQYKPGECHYLDKKNKIRVRQFTDPTFVPPSVRQARKILQDQVLQRRLNNIENSRKLRKTQSAPPFRKSASDKNVKFINNFNIQVQSEEQINDDVFEPKLKEVSTESDTTHKLHSAGSEKKHIQLNTKDYESNRRHSHQTRSSKNDKVPDYYNILNNPDVHKDRLKQLKSNRQLRSAESSKTTRTYRSTPSSLQKFTLPNIDAVTNKKREAIEILESETDSEDEQENIKDDESIITKLRRYGIIPTKSENEKQRLTRSTSFYERSNTLTARSMDRNSQYLSKSANFGQRKSAPSGTSITKDMLRKEASTIQEKVDNFFDQLEEERYKLMLHPEEEEHFFTDSEDEQDADVKETEPLFSRKKSLISPRDLSKKPNLGLEKKPSFTKKKSRWSVMISEAEQKDTLQKEKSKQNKEEESEDEDVDVYTKLMRRNSTMSRKGSLGPPMHAAERSNRHTATFKLKRVVEEIMSNKTRYEIFEIKEARKRIGSEADTDGHLVEKSENTDESNIQNIVETTEHLTPATDFIQKTVLTN